MLGFILFILLLVPLSSYLVQSIVGGAMKRRAVELIHQIERAKNDEEMIKILKNEQPLLFFRVSVINNDRQVLYDSHIKELAPPRSNQNYIINHPEVIKAFEKGTAYSEEFSELLGQKFAYLALRFDFHGQDYVLRTSFPYRYVDDLKRDLELGFFTLALFTLFLFYLLNWLTINHFTKPIQTIINQVRPYQEGKTKIVPKIDFQGINKKDDFALLGQTLNSLNEQIQNQIDSATRAAKERGILLQSLTEGVIAVDQHGIIYYANQSALNIFGLAKEELVGKSFDKTPFNECGDLLTQCLAENKVLSDSIEFSKLGRTRYLNLVAAPKSEGTGALLVLQDVSREVQILEMRKEFIANASHELKTPITIIRGFAETLHDHPSLPEEVRRDATAKIVRNCERMTSLILDLLTLSDIENLPTSRLQRFDLSALLKKCRENLLEMYKEAQVTLSTPEPLYLTADPDLIEMLVMNLLTNGARYSPPPAQIAVEAKEDEKSIYLTVSDKGVGIPEEALPKIFDRFYRVRSRPVPQSGWLGTWPLDCLHHREETWGRDHG